MRIKLIKYITIKVERAKHIMIDPFGTLLTATYRIKKSHKVIFYGRWGLVVFVETATAYSFLRQGIQVLFQCVKQFCSPGNINKIVDHNSSFII